MVIDNYFPLSDNVHTIECEFKIEFLIVCDTKQVNQSVGAEKDKKVKKSVSDTSAKPKSLLIDNSQKSRVYPRVDEIRLLESKTICLRFQVKMSCVGRHSRRVCV